MGTKKDIQEQNKKALLGKIRLYADERGRIDKKTFFDCVVECGIGINRDTKKDWWDAFHSWGILIDSGKNTLVNPEFMEEEEKGAVPPMGTTQEVRA